MPPGAACGARYLKKKDKLASDSTRHGSRALWADFAWSLCLIHCWRSPVVGRVLFQQVRSQLCCLNYSYYPAAFALFKEWIDPMTSLTRVLAEQSLLRPRQRRSDQRADHVIAMYRCLVSVFSTHVQCGSPHSGPFRIDKIPLPLRNRR